MHSPKLRALAARLDRKTKLAQPALRYTAPAARARGADAQRITPAGLLQLQRSAGNR